MKIYYWKEKKNFGDLLTDLLVKRFLHKKTKWSKPNESELVMVGSILHQLPQDYNGIIAGCGSLYPDRKYFFPNAKILSVRGPLTLKQIVKRNIFPVIGDPGLLADELVGYQDKKWDLGIVPHWTDTTLEHDPRFTVYNPKIIRVGDDSLKVIREIGSCKKIVSSSLHGIILADAFGIPRRIEIAPKMIIDSKNEGGVFKWKDYSASLGVELKTGVTQEIDRNIITQKQHELFDLFEELKKAF